MSAPTPFPNLDRINIGKLSLLELVYDDIAVGFVALNTVKCSNHMIRNIFVPFLHKDGNNWDIRKPCVYGILHQLKEIYSKDFIRKGVNVQPVYKSRYPHILIQPPLIFETLIQQKIYDKLVLELDFLVGIGLEDRMYSKNHNKKTFAKFPPLSLLSKLFGINVKIEEGDYYRYTSFKKYGDISRSRKDFERFTNGMQKFIN